MEIDISDPRLSASERSWIRAIAMRLARPLADYCEPKRLGPIPGDYQEQWARMFAARGDVDAAEKE